MKPRDIIIRRAAQELRNGMYVNFKEIDNWPYDATVVWSEEELVGGTRY